MGVYLTILKYHYLQCCFTSVLECGWAFKTLHDLRNHIAQTYTGGEFGWGGTSVKE